MKLVCVVFTLCLLNLEAKAQGGACVNNGQVGVGFNDTEIWVELSQQMSLTAAEKDFKGFCEWNRMDRASGLLTKSAGKKVQDKTMTQYRVEKLRGDRDQAASALLPVDLESLADPWEASMMGHPTLKSKSSKGTYFESVCLVKEGCRSYLLQAFKSKDLKGNYDVPIYKTLGPLKVSQAEIMGACGFLSPLGTISCSSATKELLPWVEIHKGNASEQITGVPLLTEALSDQKLTPALQRTAVKLYEKLESGKMKKNDSIFTDLTEELQKEGFSAEEARRKAVQVLGAISSGGPNLAGRINYSEIQAFPRSCTEGQSCNLNGIFMQALAEGMVYGDTLMMQAGHPSVYSLPPGAGFPCDSGKSYHFWATAAWTDRLMEKGYSASAARAAVYASHIGYHLRGDNQRRDNGVLSMPRYGSVENGLRVDLNMAAAGSAFGAKLKNLSEADSLKMKEGFLETLSSGNQNPANPGTSFERTPAQVYEWTQRVAVKTAFEFYQK